MIIKTVKLSSVRQVTIPKAIYDKMKMKKGLEFLVTMKKGEIVFKPIPR